MLKKQNRDPNRSIGVKSSSSNKLMDKKQHNTSINTISSQYYPLHKQQKAINNQQDVRENKSSKVLTQKNKNSRILAQIKQSKQVLLTKRQDITKSSNISTTRTNYKPKFILKQLMNENYHEQQEDQQQQHQECADENQEEQEENEDESYQNGRESMCENYVFGRNRFQLREDGRGNGSDTFNNNSPLGSQSFVKVNTKNNNKKSATSYENGATSKSVMLSKRTQLQQQDRTWRNTFQQADYENIKNLNKPISMGNMFNKKRQKTSQTEESVYQQKDLFSHDGEEYENYYQETSTIEYPRKLFGKKTKQQEKVNEKQQESQQDDNYQFQSKLRSISSTNPCRPGQQQHQQRQHHQIRSLSSVQNPNYKTSYLETKKQLQIRSAYFNEAIELCKHIIGGIKEVLEEEYGEGKSDRILWCHERCEDVLGAFQGWIEK